MGQVTADEVFAVLNAELHVQRLAVAALFEALLDADLGAARHIPDRLRRAAALPIDPATAAGIEALADEWHALVQKQLGAPDA